LEFKDVEAPPSTGILSVEQNGRRHFSEVLPFCAAGKRIGDCGWMDSLCLEAFGSTNSTGQHNKGIAVPSLRLDVLGIDSRPASWRAAEDRHAF
jgi:hypothetical protein